MEALSLHLDTHVAVWLFAEDKVRLKPVWKHLSSHPLRVAPMVVLELQFLHEIGRLKVQADEIMARLTSRFGVGMASAPSEEVMPFALSLSWTRDLFDRLIVAQALAERALLLTKDRTLQKNYPGAGWTTLPTKTSLPKR